MAAMIQSVKGMNDILPQASAYWHYLQKQLLAVVNSYAYQEIRFPIVEKTALFKRAIGEVTDIVEKEMYTFLDNNGDSLTLRPEGTAGCIRACLQNNLINRGQTQRLWYLGPMYRHENPQRGRYRQFYQLGVEAFGFAGPDIDAEMILMTSHFWRRVGIFDKVSLQINSLGTLAERLEYRAALVDYFKQHLAALDADSLHRLEKNPLRILDSKNPDMQTIIAAAPSLLDYLTEASLAHFERLQTLLHAVDISFEVNPRLVRGLDYYTHTVFEWVTSDPVAQNTICAGGRFDGLVEQLGGQATPAMGFAVGLERVLLLLQQDELLLPAQTPIAYLITVGEAAQTAGFRLQELIRTATPETSMIMHAGGGSFKSQFKKADKSGAQLALIIGDEEAAQQRVTIKFLREDKAQLSLPMRDIIGYLDQI